MGKNLGISGPFALLLGAFLLAEGIWGHLSDVVFGILTTNKLHAAIHVTLGLIGIFTAMKAGARPYALYVGALLLVVGVLFYVPGVSSIIVSLLNVNSAVAIVNIIIGAIALVVAFTTPKLEPVGA